jgi:hypothetical protein
MAQTTWPFTVRAGAAARFYPAHVEIKDRTRPGLRYELAPGAAWRWVGEDGPVEAELVDVLAAATLAAVARRPLLAAHAAALRLALAAHDLDLAGRLAGEQADVLDLVGGEELAATLGVTARTMDNYRLNRPQRICPPVLVVGVRRTRWLWARVQAERWRAARPGLDWRRGVRTRGAGHRPKPG